MSKKEKGGVGHVVRDAFMNVLTLLGISGSDKRMKAVAAPPIELSQQDLEYLYAGDDLSARVCDLPADEMTRRWLKISTDNEEDREAAEAIMADAGDLDIQENVKEALIWARLHGGAIIIMGIDDGREMHEPVDESRIKKIEYLTIFDRWEVRVFSTVAKFGKDFGKPETYELLPQAFSTITGGVTAAHPEVPPVVHADRVLRFDGVTSTHRRKRQKNQGWNDSALTRVYEVIRDYSSAYAGVFHNMQHLNQPFYKLKGLANMLRADQDDVVLSRIQTMEYSRSVVRAIPLDQDEEIGTLGQSLQTVDKILGKCDERLSQALGWPITVLMGRSPAGMNATGQSDLEIFYDAMEAEQQRSLKPPLERFYRYLQLAKEGPTGGRELEAWEIKFHPLWQQTEEEQAKTRKTVAEADALNIDRGVYTAEEAANSHYGGEQFSIDITLDKENREAMQNIEEEPPEPAPEPQRTKPPPTPAPSGGTPRTP